MRAILGGIVALSIAVPAVVVVRAPAVPHRMGADLQRPQRIVAPTELPAVEPVEFQEVAPDDARAYNATIPFVRGPNPAARPFRFIGDEAQRTRATDCLAAAAWYEAGDDATGQKAVVQVVLNRLRHPAFPKTVCGVVFQGQERQTGCQFTFTCDGALTRAPSPPAWDRARAVAKAALNGTVYRPVGYATHYHTDWVVPYWSASLDKIAEVHTHLFFRWTGWWGTPPAFRRAVSSDEPIVAKMAALSGAHRLGAALDEAMQAVAAAAPFIDESLPGGGPAPAVEPLAGATPPRPLGDDPNAFVVLVDARTPDTLPALAQRACGERPKCKLLGWIDSRLIPSSMTMSPQQYQSMGFSYLRDRQTGYDRALWNCGQFPRAVPAQCMRGRTAMTATPTPAASPTPRGPAAPSGVRKDIVPVPKPVDTPVVRAGVPVPKVTASPVVAGR